MAKRVWLTEDDLKSLSADELRTIVARHQRIFDSSSGYGFWEWDMRTHHFDWSGEFWQQLGYGEDDAHYINDARRLPELIHPDDRVHSQDAIVHHLKTGESLNVTFRVRAKDGGYRWSQCLADSMRDENGWVVYLSGINFDITGLKEAEDETRRREARQMRIINASNDGIWEWSAEEDTFFYSKRCFEQIGIPVSDEDLQKGFGQFKKFRDLIVPQDRRRVDLAWRRHLRNQAPFDVEYRIIGGGGQLYWIRARGQAIFDEQGNAVSFSGTNLDITELKQAEERVMQAKEAAEKANQAKSQFLSSMSHELRTPLNAILGFSQLFDFENDLTDSQRENIREIRKAGQHLLRLINDVLDLAKIESGKLTLSLEPVLPGRIIEECRGLMQSLADSWQISLRVDTAGLDNVYLYADAVRLKQVCLNLISNAIKYNRPEGSVVVRFVTPDPDHLTIQVQDTGYGIPESQYEAVFEPFNRLGAEQSDTEGSGVGLVITQQLMEMMGGQLEFHSEVGEGSCFSVTLKRVEQWSADDSSSDQDRKRGQAPTLDFEGERRILYIEDNASNVRLMEQMLQRFPQIKLYTANEAFRGLYRARTEKPDLIILDINLPGIDGFEALKVLKKDPATAQIPVIALSANAMPYDIERGLQAGFESYLTKPVLVTELMETLNRLLAREEALSD
ncbi:PAS domain-containing hybrid sensor histidine kinase/response regulator [Gilvimarinus sp. F26214L]|uniref:PAS domain-containing hybrid sensor histidine kinase/response regulator n=1 Tax=Gilvimarinus sp. DZF01 TaxID=3461371 RepID=UPI004045E876